MKYLRTALFLAIVFALLFTRTAHASSSVQINEIAWMGTSVSANAEWIEVYNPDSSPVNLKDWKLKATDGSPNIILSGIIPGNGYYLLERTSDDTVPGITANQIYTGALSNSGEHLQLIDSTGAVVDDVDGSSGWQAGDDATKNTMQRSGSSWITAVQTPNALNATTAVAVSVASNSSNSDSSNTNLSNSPVINSDQNNTSTPNQVLNMGKSVYELPVEPDPKYSARVSIPDSGVVGADVPMKVAVKINGHHDFVSGKFVWTYGDGSSELFIHNTPPKHVYYYPGTYTVTLVYYSDEVKEDPDYIYKKTITIAPAHIAITGLTDDDGVILENKSTGVIDLEGFKLKSGNTTYLFPKYTLLQKSDSLYVSSHVLGFVIKKSDGISLLNPSNNQVSHVW